jgi:hypothetical protein
MADMHAGAIAGSFLSSASTFGMNGVTYMHVSACLLACSAAMMLPLLHAAIKRKGERPMGSSESSTP